MLNKQPIVCAINGFRRLSSQNQWRQLNERKALNIDYFSRMLLGCKYKEFSFLGLQEF